ncbi:hypothetical protein CA54_25380 [Symmachiella macrocystis]|uniref:Uncharacterized protein n=1 Tax=Symmachiella macrocystis TaxID=2527985 RepID=A0A5C6BNG7_9PLAN|nr:hypothetical protein [Symmachiella macrocystis]TWU13703.1 hypothetical protein CA54_25380 [Symmachiella macrocystis]
MKQKFKVDEWIKMSRGMAFFCIAFAVFCIAAEIYLGGDRGSSVFNLMGVSLLMLSIAYSTMFHVFRSQQSEIKNLKAAVERLQNGDSPVESMTAPQIEGVTTT